MKDDLSSAFVTLYIRTRPSFSRTLGFGGEKTSTMGALCQLLVLAFVGLFLQTESKGITLIEVLKLADADGILYNYLFIFL